MRSPSVRAGMTLALALIASGATAQTPPPAAPPTEPPKWGMSIGYPGTIGIVWQPNERVAFRPDVTFGYQSSGGTDTNSSKQWKVGTGLSTLIYLHEARLFRVYVSPRYGYRRISLTTKSTTNTISFTAANSSRPRRLPNRTPTTSNMPSPVCSAWRSESTTDSGSTARVAYGTGICRRPQEARRPDRPRRLQETWVALGVSA